MVPWIKNLGGPVPGVPMVVAPMATDNVNKTETSWSTEYTSGDSSVRPNSRAAFNL
jgi:hypothetical protein